MDNALNRAELLEQVDGDLEFLAETVDMLREDGPAMLGELREAIAGRDNTSLQKVAHTFKGMLGNFCAEASGATAQRLEANARAGEDYAAAEPLVEQLQAEFERLVEALDSMLHASPSAEME